MLESLPNSLPDAVAVPNQPGVFGQNQQMQSVEVKSPAPIKQGSDEDYRRYLGIELTHADLLTDQFRRPAPSLPLRAGSLRRNTRPHNNPNTLRMLVERKTYKVGGSTADSTWTYNYPANEHYTAVDEARGPHVWTFNTETTQQTGRPVARYLGYTDLARFKGNHHRRQFAPKLNALDEAEAVQRLMPARAEKVNRKQPNDLMLMIGSAVLAFHATIQATKRGTKNTWNWLNGERRSPTRQTAAKSARLA